MARVKNAILTAESVLMMCGYYINGKYSHVGISFKIKPTSCFIDQCHRLRFSVVNLNDFDFEVDPDHFDNAESDLKTRFGDSWKSVIAQSVKQIMSGLDLVEIEGKPNEYTKPETGFVWTERAPKVWNNQFFPKIIGTTSLLVWVPNNGELFDDNISFEVDCIPVYGETDQPEFDF